MTRPLRLAVLALPTVSVALLCACGGSKTPAPITPPTSKPLSFPALIAKVRSGVIRIETTTCDGVDVGTGIVIGPKLIATVEHVVGGASSIALKQNGKTLGYGTVVGLDTTRDVALIRSDVPLAGYHFHFAARAPLLGEDVAAIGFPLGLPLTVTRGSVSGLDRTVPIDGIHRTKLVQTDAPVNPGNSGGPLMTDSGAVVGLVDLGTSHANGLAFAVGADVAGPLIKGWTVAPQPTSNKTCATPAPTPTGSAQTSLSYTGSDFSIDYPSDWLVSHIREGGGNLDSTFEPSGGGGLLMRVDENPNAGAITPSTAAAPVIAALQKNPSYINLGTASQTFDGFPALRWEFEDNENGIEMHKVDEFFTDANGRGWGILIQAPQTLWGQDGSALGTYQATFNSFSTEPQSGPADAVYTYWSQLELNHYAQAFDLFTPAEQQLVGGRTKFLDYYKSDPVLSVNVNVNVQSNDGTNARVDVVDLQTQGGATGCRNWTGSYGLELNGSQWLINYANLKYTAC